MRLCFSKRPLKVRQKFLGMRDSAVKRVVKDLIIKIPDCNNKVITKLEHNEVYKILLYSTVIQFKTTDEYIKCHFK